MAQYNFLPSKKFIKTVVGVILLVGIIILIGSLANKKTFFSQPTSKGKVLVVDDVLDVDTDGDGLKDWEEKLWGTDLKKPDTDGDGTNDGAEIRKVQEFLMDTSKDNPDAPQNDRTKTGALTRDIITIAQAINQSGPLTQESGDSITTEIANYLAKHDIAQFTLADITILDTANEKQTNAYMTLIKESVKRTTLTESDARLIADYETNMDTGDMTAYIIAGEKFKKEAIIVKKIPAPEKYSKQHLQYLNSLQALGNFYQDLALQEEDPAKALAAFVSAESVFNQYQKVLELMQN